MTARKQGLKSRASSALCVIAMLTGLSSHAAPDRGHVYDGIMTGLSVRLYAKDKVLAIGETVYDATYCAPSDEFHCFGSGPSFAFAVPRSGLEKGRTWVTHGKTYRISAAPHNRSLFGHEYEVCVIESSFRDRGELIVSKFLYSPRNGLLVMEVRILAKDQWSGDVYVSRNLLASPRTDDVDLGYGATEVAAVR